MFFSDLVWISSLDKERVMRGMLGTVHDMIVTLVDVLLKFIIRLIKGNMEEYILETGDKYDRKGVMGYVFDVSKDTGPWTYAHEFGHCYGLPDENGYNPDAEENVQVVYYNRMGLLMHQFLIIRLRNNYCCKQN